MDDRCGISLGFPDVPNYPEIKHDNSTDGKVYVGTENGMEEVPWWKIGRALRCAALRSERRGFTLTVMAAGTLTDWSAVRRMSGTAL